ncbi:MAG: InlB B-repeat-containing protein [Treponema sp.]|nr:InlB B-repeat-containing protein [Treponema sp.]
MKKVYALFLPLLLTVLNCKVETVEVIKEPQDSAQTTAVPTKIYTVSYESEFGTAPDSFMCQDGYRLLGEELPVLSDTTTHKFKGWYSEQKKIENGSKVEGNLTLKAVWERYAYSINYDLSEVTSAPENPNPVNYTQDILPLTLTPLSDIGDYKFFGWADEENALVTEITSDSAADLHLHALWSISSDVLGIHTAYYKVNHWLQNIEDDEYTLSKTEYLEGNINDQTKAKALSIGHFETKTFHQEKLLENDTVVNIYYDREIINAKFCVEYFYRIFSSLYNRETFYFEYELFSYALSSRDEIPVIGKYGEKIKFPDINTKEGFTIDEEEKEKFEKQHLFFDENTKNETFFIAAFSPKEFYCTDASEYYPSTLLIPVNYRDFKGFDETGTKGGFVTQEQASLYGSPFVAGHGHPDFRINGTGSQKETGIVKNFLNSNEKPVFNTSTYYGITQTSFDMWFNDTQGINIRIPSTLVLKLVDTSYYSAPFYLFKSGDEFDPIHNTGFGKNSAESDSDLNPHINSGWTSEIEFWFEYHGGQSEMEISHTDDCWVFANGILVLDSGGIGGKETNRICFNEDNVQDSFIQIKIFTANRNFTESVFSIKLSGFGPICFPLLR